MDSRAQARQLLEIDLRAALKRVDRIFLVADPCSPWLRSCHPRRGIISPLDFIRLRRDATYRSQLTIGCFAGLHGAGRLVAGRPSCCEFVSGAV
jgi:hypothetical protein